MRAGRSWLVIFAAGMAAACITRPTPELVERCRTESEVTVRAAPPARSVLVVQEPDMGGCVECMALLKRWRLDFVELPRPGGPAGEVDRIRLLPEGSTGCARWDRRDWTAPLSHRLRAPRGSCITVERDRVSRAELRVSVSRDPVSGGEVFKAERAEAGEPLVRIVDFALRDGPEATRVDCGDLVRDFPKNPLRFLLEHVASPAGAAR